MQHHDAQACANIIIAWLHEYERTHFNSHLDDFDIWVRIGMKWPTLSQKDKAQIFHLVTGRTYEWDTNTASSSSPASAYSSDSHFTFSNKR